MRISICFRHAGSVYRLIWVNESANGLYMGHLGGQNETHWSFHQDGREHIKMDGAMPLPPVTNTPIREWKGTRQLLNASLYMGGTWFRDATLYGGDRQTETTIVLAEGALQGASRCSFDLWLFDRPSEQRFLDLHRDESLFPGFRAIVELTVALDSFPEHKVGLTLRSQHETPQAVVVRE